MDGGRILRAQLAEYKGRLIATQYAVIVGQVFALGVGALGIVTGNLMLLLITLFIFVYAQIEARNVNVEARLRGLPAGVYALWDSGGVSPTSTLAWALRGGPRDLVVTEEGRVVGCSGVRICCGISTARTTISVCETSWIERFTSSTPTIRSTMFRSGCPNQPVPPSPSSRTECTEASLPATGCFMCITPSATTNGSDTGCLAGLYCTEFDPRRANCLTQQQLLESGSSSQRVYSTGPRQLPERGSGR